MSLSITKSSKQPYVPHILWKMSGLVYLYLEMLLQIEMCEWLLLLMDKINKNYCVAN